MASIASAALCVSQCSNCIRYQSELVAPQSWLINFATMRYLRSLFPFCGLLLLAMIFALVGCGGSGGGSKADVRRIYIADGNDRIVRIDNMSGSNWTTFGSSGNGVNQFNFLADIAFDSQGRIYCADYSNDRIVRINDMTGAGWTTFGTSGTGTNQFSNPYRLAIDSFDRIYIVDSGNYRVVRIDDMSGTNWVAYGSQGSGVGQFDGIQGIGIDSLDRIYVTDYINDRIARFDSMTGTNWTTFGTSGSGVGQFSGAADIVFNESGQMLVTDRNGQLVLTAVMGTAGWTAFSFNTPQSACFDAAGRIYVVDQGNEVLTRMNNISGAGLVTFGSSGTGVNQFQGPSTVRLGP